MVVIRTGLVLIFFIFSLLSCQDSEVNEIIYMLSIKGVDVGRIELKNKNVVYKDDFLGDEISNYSFVVDNQYSTDFENLIKNDGWIFEVNDSYYGCSEGFKYKSKEKKPLVSQINVSAFFCIENRILSVNISKQ